MNYYLFENIKDSKFCPISATRSTTDIRIGSTTFLDRIKALISSGDKLSLFVREEIADLTQERHPEIEVNPQEVSHGIWLAGNVFWTEDLIKTIDHGSQLKWLNENRAVGYNLSTSMGKSWMEKGGPLQSEYTDNIEARDLSCDVFNYLWDIIDRIPKTLEEDIEGYDSNFKVKNNSKSVHTVGENKIYVDDSAHIEPLAVLNAEKGPIIIMDNVYVNSFSYLEGPLYIGNNTIIKPHSHISSSIIGPVCKLGGEIEKTIFQGYSNKVHDGHLGNSFLGEWVNLGAGTTNSDLKNNYSSVKVNFGQDEIETGKHFIGSFIGDHVKTGIGTQLNTGTIIGPCSNIISGAVSPKYFKPFSWYVDGNLSSYRCEDFIETAKQVKRRRGIKITSNEIAFFKKLSK